MHIGDVAFERILAVILVMAAAWMVWHPVEPPEQGDALPPTGKKRWLLAGAFFVLGIYSGFVQAGIGFLFLALLSWQGLDLIRSNALKAPLILAFTGSAIALFAFTGLLDWVAGFNLAAGQFFGAKLGVHLQVLKGQAWVRNVLTVAIVVFAIRLFLGGVKVVSRGETRGGTLRSRVLVLPDDVSRRYERVSAYSFIAKVLSETYDGDPEAISPGATLTELGLDSLTIVELLFEVEDEFEIEVPEERATFKTIAEAAALVEELVQAKGA